uniref:pre-rRNA-processing protein TSR1 homolog n=1 Tax=Ciona intestinalis TaxID=7719 RepID=UPI000180C0A0|nr:pre-rRNA-processing protein TSR1 homolog [Ciona intestinalis]|eukprot:XP_002126030.1 pre-rRNA-processing protein TSR1 homolog [Ciona intestinalis]
MVTPGQHKPGIWKQQNKSHKTGRHRSKSQVDVSNKGRVEVKGLTKRQKKLQQKVDRRHRSQQIRSSKREQVLNRKRNVGVGSNPPHLTLLVPLHKNVNTSEFSDAIKLCGTLDGAVPSEAALTTAGFSMNVPRLKHRFQIFQPGSASLHDIADCARVADSVVFLVSTEEETMDEKGYDILSCLLAQGLSSQVFCVQGISQLPMKKRNPTKKEITKCIAQYVADVKLFSVDNESEAFNMLRMVAEMKRRAVGMRERRSYMLVEKLAYEDSETDMGVLKITGHVRGSALDVNRLVHLPGWGDYQIKQVDTVVEHCPWNVQKNNQDKSENEMSCDVKVNSAYEETGETVSSHPEKIQDLVLEADVDPLDGEQTWPTEEEIVEAEQENAVGETRKLVKKVPRGTSDYQAAWILDSDEDWREGSSDEEEQDQVMQPLDDEGSQLDDDSMTIADTEADDSASQYDDVIDDEADLMRFREERSHQMFPDEVDTPSDVPARTRFQRYRGLKSFRTSPWDPKENLPGDYARIFQFQSFDRTRKRMRNLEVEENYSVGVGTYVTIHLMNVPKLFVTSHTPESPITMFGLFPHEQKLSVLHFTLKQHGEHSIKNKDKLLFQCGFRRFRSKVIFSQHTAGTKHKMERYFPKEGIIVATVYAPITFPSANVLAFKERQGEATLVATGSLYKIDPDRIITKRIVLSGHPFRINKRAATIRYMFFNREDINWFKPVELRTKWGRRGHIRDPIGTHGHMKCTFDSQLTSQDTVLMTLYKRVFPKWSYEPATPVCTTDAASSMGSTTSFDEEFFSS